MPRKQRFKPSRKPKPVDAPQTDTHSSPPSETGQIDHDREPRHDESQGSIDAAGDTP